MAGFASPENSDVVSREGLSSCQFAGCEDCPTSERAKFFFDDAGLFICVPESRLAVSDSRDHLLQLDRFNRKTMVRPRHLIAERKMFFDHTRAERRGRDRRHHRVTRM